jgi:hypothetical protein
MPGLSQHSVRSVLLLVVRDLFVCEIAPTLRGAVDGHQAGKVWKRSSSGIPVGLWPNRLGRSN